MKLSHVRIHRALLAVTACGTLLLGLTGCEPKPKHEIGKVEYDKAVDMAKYVGIGPSEAKKLVGQTLTVRNLLSVGGQRKDRSTPGSCLELFSPRVPMGGASHGVSTIGVFINPTRASISYLQSGPDDTLVEEPIRDSHLTISEDLCSKCRAYTVYDRKTGEFIQGQPTEECLLESPALHITGRIVGVENAATSLLLVPTGLAW